MDKVGELLLKAHIVVAVGTHLLEEARDLAGLVSGL